MGGCPYRSFILKKTKTKKEPKQDCCLFFNANTKDSSSLLPSQGKGGKRPTLAASNDKDSNGGRLP